jgi:hypothetical protein
VVGAEPYSLVPTCDPTQRLRGNPITLNLYAFYNHVALYIITDLKNWVGLKISMSLNNSHLKIFWRC